VFSRSTFSPKIASHFPSSNTAFCQGSRSFQNFLPKVSLQVSDAVIQVLLTVSQHHPITVLTVRWRFQDPYQFNHRSDKGFLRFVQLQLLNYNHCQHCQHYFQKSPQSIFIDNNNVRDGPKKWFPIQNVCQGCLLNCGDVGFVNFALSTLEVQFSISVSDIHVYNFVLSMFPSQPLLLFSAIWFSTSHYLMSLDDISIVFEARGAHVPIFSMKKIVNRGCDSQTHTKLFHVIGYFILVFFSYLLILSCFTLFTIYSFLLWLSDFSIGVLN
jgi:hypothetical protein